MSARLAVYTDSHIPLAVVAQARAKAPGIRIIRCEEVELKDADDNEHWRYILTNWCLLVTADRGFLRRAAELNRQGRSHPGIIFIEPTAQGEPCIGPLVELLVFLHQAVEGGAAALEADVNDR